MKCKFIFLFISLLISLNSYNQIIFHQETFRGGTTGAGFSTSMGIGSGSFDIYIEPGSTIKKAWLFDQRMGFPEAATIIINGINYVFDSTLMITASPLSGSTSPCSPLAVDVIDVTNDINPAITTYNITIPVTNQNSPYACWGYSAIYLVVLYENNSLPLHHSVILLNNKQITGNDNYTVTNINPINTSYPVGFSIFSDRIGINAQDNDGSYVFINSNLLGLIKGEDNVNSLWPYAGVKGHFYYQNNTLFGLDDDTPDSLMSGTDGLADISSYIVNNSTSFNYNMQYQIPNNHTNLYNAWFLTYTTPCDTFTTTATTNIDTICQGGSVQLSATGGVNYSWFSAFSTFNDSTLANPVATPTQTTTYIVTIKNDSGCVKTEHVKVWVNPTPKPDTVIVFPQRCGSANGSITVGNIPKGTAPFTYTLINLQTLTTINQTTTVFSNLPFGNYQLSIQDNNGCQWQSDTLVVPEINDIVANFNLYTLPLVFPEPNPLGSAPLTVYSQNHSVNANSFEWTVISNQESGGGSQDTIIQHSTFNISHSFENGGTYEFCLFAYNNLPTCGDTVCKTIVIAPAPDSLVLVVPNVFSPNADGSNDNFVLQVQSANLLDKIEVEIFNRWGMLVESKKLKVESSLLLTNNQQQLTIWDGTTTSGKEVPEGTYFYVISYTKLTGKTESLKGSVSLLR